MYFVNVYEPNTGRSAHNVCISAVADAVRPWFGDLAGHHRVRSAIESLSDETQREEAMNYLGLQVVPVA